MEITIDDGSNIYTASGQLAGLILWFLERRRIIEQPSVEPWRITLHGKGGDKIRVELTVYDAVK